MQALDTSVFPTRESGFSERWRFRTQAVAAEPTWALVITGEEGGNIGRQTVSLPFQIRVRLVDGSGAPQNWSGQVTLRATTGSVSPRAISLVAGSGSATITLNTPGRGVRIVAQGAGLTGESAPFDVQVPETCRPATLTGTVKRGGLDPFVATLVLVEQGTGEVQEFPVWGGSFEISVPAGDYRVRARTDEDRGESDEGRIQLSCAGTARVDFNVRSPCNPLGLTPVLLVPGIPGSTKRNWAGSLVPYISGTGVRPEELSLFDSSATGGGWARLKEVLKEKGYQEGCTLFEAPYDWRLHIQDSVTRFLAPKIAEAREKAGAPKVDIVAHSMGGLLARYYIQSRRSDDHVDVARLILVGTPNRGSAYAYFLVEAGDTLMADAVRAWLKQDATEMVGGYTMLAVVNLGADLNGANPVKKALLELGRQVVERKTCSLFPPALSACTAVTTAITLERLRAAVAEYTLSVLSLPQLMPDVPFLLKGGSFVSPSFWRNGWLEFLNGSRFNLFRLGAWDDPKAVVRTRVLSGTGKNTLDTIGVRDCLYWKCPPGWYPDGQPYVSLDFQGVDGDGTVTSLGGLIPTPARPTYGGARTEDHTKLVAQYAQDIANLLQPSGRDTRAVRREAASPPDEEVTTSRLSIAFFGSVAPLLVAPDGSRVGISSGESFNEIPGASLNFDSEGGSLVISNPRLGTYQLQFTGPDAIDLRLIVTYERPDGPPEIPFFHGAHDGEGSETTLSLVVDNGSEPPVRLESGVPPVAGLRSSPTSGPTPQVVLRWEPAPGAVQYRIYGKDAGDANFDYIGITEQPEFAIREHWRDNDSSPRRLYAVVAVDASGQRSGFSEFMSNDDEDHDGIEDFLEVGYGCSSRAEDTDQDGLPDLIEFRYGLDCGASNSDGDEYDDRTELLKGSDPTDPSSTPVSSTQIPTETFGETSTATPTPTSTATLSVTPSQTPSPTATYTTTPSGTFTASSTATTITSPTPALTFTPVPTATMTATRTVAPTLTLTLSPTLTLTPTLTPTTGLGCTPRPTPATGPAVFISDTVGACSTGFGEVEVRLRTGAFLVAGTQNEIVPDSYSRLVAGPDGRPDCTVNPAINKEAARFVFQPPGCDEGHCARVQALVYSAFNVDPIPDGSWLYRCRLRVSGPQSHVEVAHVRLSNPAGELVPDVASRGGTVCCGSLCAGDCDQSRAVTIEELVTMVNIALELAPASVCRAGDANGDGSITVEEIILAVNRALGGC
ncbi:MAG: hypothetical protein KatS3mg077_3290 [Candidatus Binatia bacterium]|nr:MAG: hypothetical protein KatS3mg077_3290 [Candidatus Binatia bacterium]